MEGFLLRTDERYAEFWNQLPRGSAPMCFERIIFQKEKKKEESERRLLMQKKIKLIPFTYS